MRNAVRVFFLISVLIAPRVWAADPAITFESNAAVFSGFNPYGDIAVLAVVTDAYEESQFERVTTRQFLLTADANGTARFVLHPEADPEMEYQEFEPEAVWAAVDLDTGAHTIEKRGGVKTFAALDDADVQFIRGEGTTDEIRTTLPVAVMMVRPLGQALFNDLQAPSSTSIPLDAEGTTYDMKPAKTIGTTVNRFAAGDVVIVIDRAALRSLEKTFTN